MDMLTKSSYFIHIKSTCTPEEYARIYINDIVSLHGIPLSIILDRGAQFSSRFCRSFQKALGNKVKLRTAFHPQSDGQMEHTIQTLEYVLITYVIDIKGNWEYHLPFVEFSYNNGYFLSIAMAPFEELYGRKFTSPVGWFEVGEFSLLGPGMVYEAVEKFRLIRDRLKTTYSRRKSYADNRRRDLEFEIGDWVYLKISSMKGLMKFGKKRKLSPRSLLDINKGQEKCL